jgi:YfiH family protein
LSPEAFQTCEVSSGELPIWRFARLSSVPGLTHFVTTRAGGVSRAPYDTLNLALHVDDDPDAVRENRRRLATAIGVPMSAIFTGRQVHGAEIHVVTSAGEPEAECDALVTATPGVAVAVLVADCVPILLTAGAERGPRVAAAVHAGWRGTAQGIISRTARLLQERFDADPADMLAAIGPSIGPCCYEIGADTADQVRATLDDTGSFLLRATADRWVFDLWQANRRQLLAAGVLPTNIETAGICTRSETRRFFSARAAQGPTGRFAVGIMLNLPAAMPQPTS